MAIAPAAEGAIKDAVSQFWNDDKISVADGMASLSITSSAIAPVPDQDPGNSGGDLALDLGLAAIWTHEASGSLALAAVGREGLTVSISLPAAQDSGA
jgi:hypothetical protein